TRTKTPYSKPPIQRAISTWLTKAMAALAMRMTKATSEARPESPRSSGANSVAATRSNEGRSHAAIAPGRSRSAVEAAEKRKTHYSRHERGTRTCPRSQYARLFKIRCGGRPAPSAPSAHVEQPLQIVALDFGAQRIAEPAADLVEDAAGALDVDLVGHLDRIAEIR